jgi:hypothetical protein
LYCSNTDSTQFNDGVEVSLCVVLADARVERRVYVVFASSLGATFQRRARAGVSRLRELEPSWNEAIDGRFVALMSFKKKKITKKSKVKKR